MITRATDADDATGFWHDRSVEELIAAQGKGPVVSFDGLRDDTLSDDEYEAFLAVIA